MNNRTEIIWSELHHDLGRFIGKRVSDTQAADDILQDVFLKIHTQVKTVRDDQKLISWAYQITRHAIADFYRTPQRNVELPETLTALEVDEDDLASEFAPCLRPMLDNLPDKYREVLMLTEYQGLTLQEAAEKLQVSLSGIKSRVQRARELLKGMLLQCCHFEFDRRGRMIDYYAYRTECDANQGQSVCHSDSDAHAIQIPQ